MSAAIVVAAPIGPRPGRPRSALARRSILDAALALFGEQGLEAMSVEGVAARAGVGKATISDGGTRRRSWSPTRSPS